ncbi:MAG: hypothetical protein EOO38_05990 [Cytophagaceae bacterium]|nr:MAG: hypothetical protein EOO38_05990 [Cytophagaceae bacterium]
MMMEAGDCVYVLMCHYHSGPSRAVGVYSTWELAREAGVREWSWVRKTHVNRKYLQDELPMEHNQCAPSITPVPYYDIDSFMLNDDPD